jgi:hypothetical protein
MVESLNEVAAWSNSKLETRVRGDIMKMLDSGAAFIEVGLGSFKDKIAPWPKSLRRKACGRRVCLKRSRL